MDSIHEFSSHLNLLTRGFIPLVITLNFTLLIVLVALNWKAIANPLKGLDWKIHIALCAIFAAALLLRIFPEYRHILYIDEFFYMEAGKNLLLHHALFDYPESSGWPLILSMAFGIFGVDNHVAIFASIILGAISVFPMFLLSYIITDNVYAGLFSAAVFALWPASVLWSGTASSGAASQFFVLSTLYLCMLFYKRESFFLLLLSCVSLAFLSLFRQENLFYSVLFISGFLFFRLKITRPRIAGIIVSLLLLAVLALPNFLNIIDSHTAVKWIESDTLGAQTGSNWSLSNLTSNFFVYGPDIINGEYQPLIFSFLFIAGICFMVMSRWKEFLFLATWLVGLMLIYFTSWFQTFGGKSRFFMFLAPPIIIISSYGMVHIYRFIKSRRGKPQAIALTVLATGVLFMSFQPYIKSFSSRYTFDTHLLYTSLIEKAEEDIPGECLIVSSIPLVLQSTTSMNVVSTDKFLEPSFSWNEAHSRNNCILFFDDAFCKIWDWNNTFEKCAFMSTHFVLEPYTSYSHGKSNYTFWRILGKKPQPETGDFRVMRSIPEAGGTVKRNPGKFVFYFNKEIDEDTVDRYSFDLGEIYFSGSYSVENNALEFQVQCYDLYLEENREYIIRLGESIRSEDGTYLEPFELSFRAGSEIDPNGPPQVLPGEEKKYKEMCK